MQDFGAIPGGGGGGGGAGRVRDYPPLPPAQPQLPVKCPRCDSTNTKFCYYNNYNLAQPRHFCKSCRRYWTKGGVLRNVPVGGGCRKSKRSSMSKPSGGSERKDPPRRLSAAPRSSSGSGSGSGSGCSTLATADVPTSTTPFPNSALLTPPPDPNPDPAPSFDSATTMEVPLVQAADIFPDTSTAAAGSFPSQMSLASTPAILGFMRSLLRSIMAAVGEIGGSKKRKREPSAAKGGGKPKLTQLKNAASKPANLKTQGFKKQPKAFELKPEKPTKFGDETTVQAKKEPKTPRGRRLAAKEMAETRKKKRKPNYNLEKELASLWEKMRCYNVGKQARSELVSEALRKMNGKFVEIAGSHVAARVLQTCVKYCTQEERDAVFEALRPHLLALSRKKYAVHLVKKLLDHASKKQLEWFISSLHGHVTSLLRHSVGSAVIDYVFHLANGSQKQILLMEMYSTELQLFKDLTLTNSGRLVDIISKLGLQKSSVLQHMMSVIQSLLEKGIVDHSIIHKALMEFFTIADKSSAADVIQQLLPLLVRESASAEESPYFSAPEMQKKRKIKNKNVKEPLLARMIRTRDGLKICILCVKHASAKERKKVIKGIKGHVRKLSLDQLGSLLLVCVLSVVDDTKLVTKIVIREMQTMLKELVLDKNGRRTVLQLLHPQCSRYFAPEDLACLSLSVPSLSAQAEETEDPMEVGLEQCQNGEAPMTDNENSEVGRKSVQLDTVGKKDSFRRRCELMVESGLAEGLFETCTDNVGELLRSNFGKEVVYELAVGGSDGILQSFADRMDALHKAIASLAALPNTNESQEEHVLENFHSSRLIRKLVLDCLGFAATLWKMALDGKCDVWAQGHS